MNKWVNPEPRMKTEDESPQSVSPQNELPPQDAVTYTHANTFNTMKKQVRKKKVSRESIKERIAEKSVSLAERLGYGTTK